MRIRFLLFLFVLAANYGHGQALVRVSEKILNQSLAQNLKYFKDTNKKISPQEFIKKQWPLIDIKDEVANLDFQNARFYLPFKIKNESSFNSLYLETARPITNKVFLHKIENDKIANTFINGDNYPFSKRNVKNRMPLFQLDIKPGETKEYLLEIESDGEMISLPFIFQSERTMDFKVYQNQFTLGFYFGVLIFITILFLFFYLLLKDISFLYYILYTFALALMQFSLDGYSYQYFFPNSPWFANHIVLFSAGLTSFFVILYCKSYLEISVHLPKYNKAIKFFLVLIGIATLASLIDGPIYELCYPLINGFSLIALILVNLAVFLCIMKGIKVSIYFTLAFTILIIGAVIFILGNFNIVGNPTITLSALKISSLIEILLLSITMAYKYRDLQNERNEANKLLLNEYEEKNKLIEGINQKLEYEVKQRVKFIEHQKNTIQEKNKSITDSIEYALRIQKTILPSREKIKTLLPKSSLFYKPKDIVSGDFYFVEKAPSSEELPENEATILFSVVDCTGHGVPGALMSLIAYNNLKKALSDHEVNSTGATLDYLDLAIAKSLKTDDNEKIRDGMDLGFCAYDKSRSQIHFSGSQHSLLLYRLAEKDNYDENDTELAQNTNLFKMDNYNLYEIKGSKKAIGNSDYNDKISHFDTNTINVQQGDLIFLFTDGFTDQFGGERNKKFGRKNFREMLKNSIALPFSDREEYFKDQFEKYIGKAEQIDDILVMAVEI